MARSRENFTFTELKTRPFHLPLVLTWRGASSLSTRTSLFTTTTTTTIIIIIIIITIVKSKKL
jgi:hypothetical protein